MQLDTGRAEAALPGIGYTGPIPFKTDAITIKADSCAKTVTFVVAIADVCGLTNTSGFSDETVNLWTPAVGFELRWRWYS